MNTPARKRGQEVRNHSPHAHNHTGYAQVLEEKTTTSETTETRTYTLGHDVLAQQVETQTGTTRTAGRTLTLLYDGHGSTRAPSRRTR